MAASYPGAVKNFGTAVAPGDGILAAHVNTLREEVVAVETQLGVNAGTWQAWEPTIVWTGGNTDPGTTTVTSARYCTVGKLVSFVAQITTSTTPGNRTGLNLTTPATPKAHAAIAINQTLVSATDGSGAGFASYSADRIFINLPSATTRNGYVIVAGTYEAA